MTYYLRAMALRDEMERRGDEDLESLRKAIEPPSEREVNRQFAEQLAENEQAEQMAPRVCEGFDYPEPGVKRTCTDSATFHCLTSDKYYCSAHVGKGAAYRLPPVIDTDLF